MRLLFCDSTCSQTHFVSRLINIKSPLIVFISYIHDFDLVMCNYADHISLNKFSSVLSSLDFKIA